MSAIYMRTRLLLLFLMCSSAAADCPAESIRMHSQCVFTVECYRVIKFDLPEDCKSTDRPVAVDMTLHNPTDTIDEETDQLLLETITAFRATGHFKETNFTFLEYMPRLKHLFLVDNKITINHEMPFFHLNRLETIDLSYNALNKIADLFKFEGSDNMLKKLTMNYNDVTVIGKNTFDELYSLYELDISHNKIDKIDSEAFVNLNNLQILNLNYNNIVKLNGALNELKGLKHLYLRGNRLEDIDVEKELKMIIHHLQTFDVSENDLAELKPTMFWRHWLHFEGNSVCKIRLSDNNIVNVPNATYPEYTERYTRHSGNKYNVDVATEIDLSNNDISIVQYNAFQDIQKLVSLDLSENNIQNFRLNGFHLGDIQRLNLSNNELTVIHFESFSTMNQLENLDISYNHISFINEDTFKNNYNLKYVNFTFNNVKEIKYLHIRAYPIGNINFSNNELTKVTIGRELSVVRLFLQFNRISDMADVDMRQQIGLQYLQINNNNIRFLNESSLLLPETLVYLDMSFNDISSISPSAFVGLIHMVTLRLTHNKLKSLEFGMFRGLKSLRNMDLSYNELPSFTSKVVSELKMLQFLSLKYNRIESLDYDIWIGHKFDLHVYIDGNNLSCDWLIAALNDYNSGYSKMKPSSHIKDVNGNSVDGIPCISVEDKLEKFGRYTSENVHYVLADERLLMINKKILEAIRDQTYFLKKYLLQSTLVQNNNNFNSSAIVAKE